MSTFGSVLFWSSSFLRSSEIQHTQIPFNYYYYRYLWRYPSVESNRKHLGSRVCWWPICHRRLALFVCQKTSEVLSSSQNSVAGSSRPYCSPLPTHMWCNPCCSCFCAPAWAMCRGQGSRYGLGEHEKENALWERFWSWSCDCFFFFNFI